MKPIPDDPRILHILDVFWREIKSINWQDFQTYAIIGLLALMVSILFLYLLRVWQERSE
jgi:hypothetical protein